MTGEISSDRPTSPAFFQLTPAPNRASSQELARPTPMMAPISVCELEAGMPRNHVPKFQMMAAIKRASTIARPAPVSMWTSMSTGSRWTMLKATATPPRTTPRKFISPDQTTAYWGLSDLV